MARSWLLGHPVEFNFDEPKQGTIVRTYIGNIFANPINPNPALMLVVQLETGMLVTIPADAARVLDEPSAK